MDDVQFDEQKIIPVVVQDSVTRTVLFLGYMNPDALLATQSTGLLHLWSRSRNYLRVKGERSGHYQGVEEIRLNCDGRSLLVLVRPEGPAGHNGYESCFYRRLDVDS